MNFKLRTYYNNTTARIINTFTNKFCLNRPCFPSIMLLKDFNGLLLGPTTVRTSSAIINQSINSFLKHPFFVADNNFWSSHFQ